MQLTKKYQKALEFLYYKAYNKGRHDEKYKNKRPSDDTHFKSTLPDIEKWLSEGELF